MFYCGVGMRKNFSKHWKSSKQPRKQRKYRFNAPLHIRRKMLSAHLDKVLREKYNTRAFPVRTGDVVVAMRGKFKNKKGKVVKVDLKKLKIYVDEFKTKKATGQEVYVPIDPSNVKIVELNLSDKKRLKRLESKKKERGDKK